MQHADDSGPARLLDHRRGVLFRFPRVHDDRATGVSRERELRGERAALLVARRMIVVVIQPALSDRDRAGAQELSDGVGIPERVEARGIVRMHPGGEPKEVRMAAGQLLRPSRGIERLTDTNDTDRPGLTGAVDGLIAVGVECRIREVGVAIEKRGR